MVALRFSSLTRMIPIQTINQYTLKRLLLVHTTRYVQRAHLEDGFSLRSYSWTFPYLKYDVLRGFSLNCNGS